MLNYFEMGVYIPFKNAIISNFQRTERVSSAKRLAAF
jgi:hypothetical protein